MDKVTTQQRRSNRNIYFQEQHSTTSTYVAPYINEHKVISKSSKILEIGCGEGGNLKHFVDLGCKVVGLDISEHKISLAEKLCPKFCDNTDNLTLICDDVYNQSKETLGEFDIVMMRDVIEHIPDQKRFLKFLRQFLAPTGIVYFGFPPWQMPFGGHQQGIKNKLSKAPFIHLLPNPLYVGLMRLFGTQNRQINSLLEVKSTGISIERFKKYTRDAGWKIVDECPYFINPNYEAKFNLKPRKQSQIAYSIPYLRNYITTCAYFLIGLED